MVELALAAGVVLGALVAAAAVVVMGLWALVVPIYAGSFVAAAVWPRQTALGLLVTVVALEPQTVDVTKHLAAVAYQVPPGIEQLLPLTIAPCEMLLVVLLASIYLPGRSGLRTRPPVGLPVIVFCVPLVVLLAALFGLRGGAPPNLTYIEARGILYGAAAFLIALRIAPDRWDVLSRWVLIAAGLLAVITIYRYVVHVRTGDLHVAAEFAFAHESPIFLSTGLIVAGLLAIRNGRSLPERAGFFLYGILILAALITTQRRAATAVLLVAMFWTGLTLFPRRPVLVALVAIPLLVGGSVYTAAYWNKEYGATAQPARAIRSQIDPSPRDESSDLYREIERHNVIETIRATPLFGLGFGRPFFLYRPLPDLTSFWPLQFYTPHQNVLWLWLKLGFAGITVFLSVAAIAVSRCLGVMRAKRWSNPEYLAATVLSAVVLMYLVFGTIDLAFTGTRPMGPLAAAIALCFALGGASPRAESAPAPGFQPRGDETSGQHSA